MLRPRIIPCLLVHNGGLVKTVQFANPKYVGDPLNAVRIFNEKEVDELTVLDIDATVRGREPDYNLIKNLAAECRMPLCYGGGVKTVEQIERIVSLGVEKVAISSAAIDNPELIANAAMRVGNQSVLVVLDIREAKKGPRYQLYCHNGIKATGLNALEFAEMAADLGAGELVINSIDRDGMMQGYDLELAKSIRGVVNIPLTILGGAGSLGDLQQLIKAIGVAGAAAGSLFVFKGVYRAVLISYPGREERVTIVSFVNHE